MGRESFFVQRIHTLSATYCSSLGSGLSYRTDSHGITVLVFQSPLCYSLVTPKRKSSDASNLHTPKGSPKVLIVSEKVLT